MMKVENIEMRRTTRQQVFLEWNKLCQANHKATPFQQWELHDTIARHYIFFFLAKREWPCYYAFYKNKALIMIAPLCRRLTLHGIEYVSFGATPTIAFQDFIYDDSMTEEEMTYCLHLLKQECGSIQFYNVQDDCMLFRALNRELQPQRENTNITVPLGESYEKYYSSLSKNTRQNVRTAYNRIDTDGKKWTVELKKGKDVTDEEHRELMDVYVNRRRSRYRTTSALHEWFLRHEHFNTIAMRRLESARFIILRIDGTIAAFLSGYIDSNVQSLLIPRLAISSDFGRYSPGVILINESMKLLESSLHLQFLDLSKGDEKYKSQMGGEFYPTYDFVL